MRSNRVRQGFERAARRLSFIPSVCATASPWVIQGCVTPLPSLELIADCVEVMTAAHGLDSLVLIPNCDQIVPGMLRADAGRALPRPGRGLERRL